MATFWKIILVPVLFSYSLIGQAGVFDMPIYVEEGENAIGLEPEVVFSDPAGVGVVAHYSRGMSELLKLGTFFGTNNGDRAFRMGFRATFDFFPDTSGQPGLGIGTQYRYSRVLGQAQNELTLVPYVHKSFLTKGTENEFAPYVAFPFGYTFQDGSSVPFFYISIGSSFRESETFSFLFELGVAINNSDSFFSGGVVFYLK